MGAGSGLPLAIITPGGGGIGAGRGLPLTATRLTPGGGGMGAGSGLPLAITTPGGFGTGAGSGLPLSTATEPGVTELLDKCLHKLSTGSRIESAKTTQASRKPIF